MAFFKREFFYFFACICAMSFPFAAQAQNREADSLKKLLPAATHDTVRMHIQNNIGMALYSTLPDSAMTWWMRTHQLAEQRKDLYTGKTRRAVLLANGDALTNIAFIYTNRGMTGPGLEYNFKSLRLREDINDAHGVAESLNNIAFAYGQQGDTAKALEYYERSAAGYQAINDTGGVAYTIVNRAQIYVRQRNDSMALKLYLQARQTLSVMPDQSRGYGTCLSSIGMIYLRAKNYDECLRYLRMSLAVREQAVDLAGMASSCANIGRLYKAMNERDSAFYYAQRAYDLARKVHSSSAIISSAELLSTLYADDGNHSKALEFYRIYINSRDSVRNEENSRNMMRQQMGYEYGKKSAADSLNFEREREVGEVKLSRQRGYTIGGFSALAIVGLLLVFVYRQRNRIASEKKRSDELLLNILPAETAEELKATGTAKTKNYDSVTVMFTDFKNFTKTAEQLSAEDLVALINLCYAEFDRIISRHRLEKIKTIGDSYMCAGGLPVANETHAEDAVAAALEMIVFIRKHNEERKRNNLPFFDIRIGLHTGQVVAGIVGIKKFAYDIWGDTVNIASRMESSGEPDRINISESTYLLVKDKFHCEYRGKVQAKNKGEIDMYFVKEETSRIP